jgi:integrase
MTDKLFSEAAESYIQHGGSERYLDPIITHFVDKPLRSIYPFDLKQMALKLYPDHKNSTLNRQAITPARAVIMHGYERGWCDLIRVKRFKEDESREVKPATPIWLHSFCRQCEKDKLNHLAALVLFMAHTGARISEAISLTWDEVDLGSRTALLLKTKTERNSTRYLTDELLGRIQALKQTSDLTKPVFGYTSRHSVNERIQAVCERADIPYKSPHVCGRHTFATTAINAGLDIRTTMEAGGWKSSSVFLEIYVHPRNNSGRAVAERLNSISIGF